LIDKFFIVAGHIPQLQKRGFGSLKIQEFNRPNEKKVRENYTHLTPRRLRDQMCDCDF